MKIVTTEELESFVYPIYNHIFQFFDTPNRAMLIPGETFNIMRFLYNNHEGLDVKPDCLMDILADLSTEMGDMFFYLSFPFTESFTHEELPRHFKLTADEIKESSVNSLEGEAGKLISLMRPKPKEYFYPEPLIYSPQGLWAVSMNLDHIGWLGTNEKIINHIRNKYSNLDRELERQFFDFVAGYNALPFDWKYTIGDDRVVCSGWLREMITYMCRQNINLNEGTDITEAYRTLLYQAIVRTDFREGQALRVP